MERTVFEVELATELKGSCVRTRIPLLLELSSDPMKLETSVFPACDTVETMRYEECVVVERCPPSCNFEAGS